MGDLAGGVHCDVDPAAFERADAIAAFGDSGKTNPTLKITTVEAAGTS